MPRIQTSLVVLCLVVLSVWASEDKIFSCGGFVKTDFPVEFAKIKVKLYTKEGSLKYQSDCAPNNGYYMIPVYSEGSYDIKLDYPSGWFIEPASIPLSLDGTTDPCTKGEDINFQFRGFSLSGKVVSRGKSTGPDGLVVELRSQDGSVVTDVHTDKGGSYEFSKILPGRYQVGVAGLEGCAGALVQNVEIKDSPVKVPKAIEIPGYSLSGAVISDGISGVPSVNILLLSKLPIKEISGCSTKNLEQFSSLEGVQSQTEDKEKLMCYVSTDSKGSFRFPCLVPGTYKLIPELRKNDVTFDIIPASKSIEIAHANVDIAADSFKVSSFSVPASVWFSDKGPGVPNADVLLDGKVVATTDSEGGYTLKGLKPGHYELLVNVKGVEFEPVPVTVSLEKPLIPLMVAKQLELCGSILIEHYPKGVPRKVQHKVLIWSKGSKGRDAISVTTDPDGAFCKFLEPGAYVVEPQVMPALRDAGIYVVPARAEVTVGKKVPELITFTQFRASISGRVKCIGGSCDETEVRVLLEAGEKRFVPLKGNTFSFEHVLPGKYKLSIESKKACWERNAFSLDVGSENVKDVEFSQTGFAVSIAATQSAKVKFVSVVSEGTSKEGTEFLLKKGSNTFCLAKSGTYDITVESCHKFQPSTLRVDLAKTDIITLVATQHLVTGSVLMPMGSEEKDVALVLKSQSSMSESDTPVQFVKLELEQKAEGSTKLVYKFAFYADSNSDLLLEPKSKEYLFTPPSLTLKIMDDCQQDIVNFEGEKGLFLQGKIVPPLADVSVSLLKGEKVLEETSTDPQGVYRVGPLRSAKGMSFKATKSGYIFTPMDEGETGTNFKAYKLSQLIVKTVNDKKEVLDGVLISVSGGAANFRSNNLTDANGELTFVGLSPGDYFVRPILKEFNFEPETKLVSVSEGSTVNVELKAIRVRFSCYGTVRTLNGQALPGVALEAISPGCENLLEEAESGEEGVFRIRGLEPKCEYSLRVKGGSVKGVTWPKSYSIKVSDSDIVEKDVIVLEEESTVDIMGIVSSSAEILPTLKVSMYRADDPETSLYSTVLGPAPTFYLPPVAMDGKRRKVEPELYRGGYFMFIFAALCVLLVHYREMIFPLVQEYAVIIYENAQNLWARSPTAGNGGETLSPIESRHFQEETDPSIAEDVRGPSSGSKKKHKSRKT